MPLILALAGSFIAGGVTGICLWGGDKITVIFRKNEEDKPVSAGAAAPPVESAFLPDEDEI